QPVPDVLALVHDVIEPAEQPALQEVGGEAAAVKVVPPDDPPATEHRGVAGDSHVAGRVRQNHASPVRIEELAHRGDLAPARVAGGNKGGVDAASRET